MVRWMSSRRTEWQLTRVTGADTEDDLANVDTSNGAVRLAPSTTHARLQSIGTGARQHLVDADDVEGVNAHAQVETFLSGNLDEVPAAIRKRTMRMRANLLVGANTGGFESLGTQLFVLVGH